MLTRREFLTRTSVTLALIPITWSCSSTNDYAPASSTSATTPLCDGAGETSSIDAGHSHALCVPNADLTSPPEAGATYTTSSTGGHTHVVTLTREQLATIEAGGTTTVTTSSVEGHTHVFAIRKTFHVAVPPVAGGGGGGGGSGGSSGRY